MPELHCKSAILLPNLHFRSAILCIFAFKRRFAAGLKAAGQLVNCDDSQVNVPLAWLIEIFTLYLHKKHIIDVI